jgi:hypothetical protein
MKDWTYVLLAAAGLAIFGTMSFYVEKIPYISHDNAVILQGILGSICASYVFLIALDSVSYLRDVFQRRSFQLFFGELSDSLTTYLVYPDFVLSDQARLLLQSMSHAETFRKKADNYPGTRFVDVPKIVASNDLQAVVVMATKLGKYLRDSPILITDGQAITDSSRSLLSFGLTSNAVTELYQRHDQSPLFRIEDPEGEPKLIVESGGKVKRFGRENNYQYGIIMRYRPNPSEYPNRFWIICAGLGAAGTPAAAWRLSHNWRPYHRRFGQKDFLIVIKTSNDIHAFTSSIEVFTIER